jgi:oligopeptide transport system ATP-binding protein
VSLLDVTDLRISYGTPRGELIAVDGVSLAIEAGGSLGIAGESGSGKSQLALALLGLNGADARIAGSIRFDGAELRGATAAQWNRVRGARIGMVFQDPMTALNPHLTIGAQLCEVLELHRGASRASALAEAQRMLERVHVADARRRLAQYPHELSGGLRQRAMIAGALLAGPQLLVADEPTTALDATVQAQLIDLLGELRRELGMALLLVSHDLAVVGELCERALVMYAGRVMEAGPAADLLARPAHPYTQALLRARPGIDTVPGSLLSTIPGSPPDPLARPRGCPFQPRCVHALDACAVQPPPLVPAGPGRVQACVLARS